MKLGLGQRPLLMILLLALALRLAAGFWWQRQAHGQFEFGDSDSYWALGRAVAHGGPYRFGDDQVFRAPGYPMLLAPLFWLGGDNPSPLAARALSALCGTAAVWAVVWLAGLLFDRRTALLAGLLAAVYPGAVALGGVVLSEAPFCPLMMAQLALWTLATRRSQGLWWALAAGLTAGLATLVRPSWLFFTPMALAVAVAFGPSRTRQLRLGLVVLLGLALAMAPWWYRNWRVTGHFVATTLQVGASLYDGLSPQATGASDMTALGPAITQAQRDWEAAGRPGSIEYYLDQHLRRAALDWARQHPGTAIRLAATKFLRFWNVWPNEASLSSWPARLVVVFTFVPIAVCGIIGALRTVGCRGRVRLQVTGDRLQVTGVKLQGSEDRGQRAGFGWPYVSCWLPALYLTLLHLVFVSSLRYREPAMLGLIVLAAAALTGHRSHDSGNPSHDE